MKSSKLTSLTNWYRRHLVGTIFILASLITLFLASVVLVPRLLPHHLGDISTVKAELSAIFDYTGWEPNRIEGEQGFIAENINECITLIKVIGDPVKVIEIESEVSEQPCLQEVREYFFAVMELIGTDGWKYRWKRMKSDLDKTIESASKGQAKVEIETLTNSYLDGYKHYNKIDYPKIYTYDVERVICTSTKTDTEKVVKLRLEAL